MLQSSVQDPGWNEWLSKLSIGMTMALLVGVFTGLALLMFFIWRGSEERAFKKLVEEYLKKQGRYKKTKQTPPEGDVDEVNADRFRNDRRMRL